MSVLDKVRQHAEPKLVRRLEVPEWGDPAEFGPDGAETVPAKPLEIFYTMLTLGELAEIEQLGMKTFSEQAAHIVAMKACDAAGKPLFKRIDARTLQEEAAPDVVKRIALEILGRVTVEDARKN